MLVLLIVVGLALVAGGRALGRRAFLVGAAATGGALAWALGWAGAVLGGAVPRWTMRWVPGLDLALGFRLDGFSLVMVLLVAGIGVLVQLGGLSAFARDRPGQHRLAGLLLVFTASMLGVVTASNLIVLYVAWELTSVSSYLLVGWNDEDPSARAAALQALLTTGLGGLAMLGGFVVIGQAAGTYDLAAIAAAPPTGTAVSVGLVLVLVGVATKSAQVPFSSWLPGAMVAPTIVSAYLHSATMVKAGVYLVARLAPVFADQGPWRPVVLVLGIVTMVSGGWRALGQHDLKRILAFGTISQLGFLVILFGIGSPEASAAGVALLVAHALFKACLFLVVGTVDHAAGTRDIRRLGRYGPGWGVPKALAVLSGASMAGIPLLFGFVGKESALAALVEGHGPGTAPALVGVVVGSVLTFAYTVHLLRGAFGPPAANADDLGGAPEIGRPPVAEWAPAAVLVVPTVVLGLVPGLADRLLGTAAHALDPEVHHLHLALWHGWGAPVALSLLIWTLGALVAGAATPVERLRAALPRSVDGTAVYGAIVRGLNRTADRITGWMQPGSLPVYTGVILLTAVIVPGAALAGFGWPDRWPALVTGPGDLAVAGLVVAGGIAATVVRHRLAAVLCVGAVGYGMALVFVLQGAPDLALTQVCIDTLGAVVFVLVLRRLPDRFGDRVTPLGRVGRLVVSGAVGLFVFFAIVIAVGVPRSTTVATDFLEQAPEAGGKNVVNVVVVDIRGFDTMGEITVLTVASLGIYSLARLSRRERGEERSFAPTRRAGGGAP